jgi:hypothetical protein
MTKPGSQSVDWRRVKKKDSNTLNCWKQVRRSGIDQLRMMVDNVNAGLGHQISHQTVARAHKPMTLSEWNTVFACANMTVYGVMEPADLTVTTPTMKADGEQFFVLFNKASQ